MRRASVSDPASTYRPRYTLVMRALTAQEPLTIGDIAEHAGITQPAATQTVALMIKEGWLTAAAGEQDGRRKMVRLSKAGRAKAPHLQQCWQATAAAAASLDAQLPYPLSEALASAIKALNEQSFGDRIRAARAAQENK